MESDNSLSNPDDIAQAITALNEKIAENEEKQELAVDLKPGDELFDSIQTECAADSDVEDPLDSTYAVIRHQLSALQDEHDQLTDELDELKSQLHKQGLVVDDTAELAATFSDLKEASVSDWKRKADEELDQLELLCPHCADPKREHTVFRDSPTEYSCKACGFEWSKYKRNCGASGFTGLDSSLSREKKDLERIYGHSKYEEEVHALDAGDEMDTADKSRIDTWKVFSDEHDAEEYDEPVTVEQSGAIYHEFGRITPTLAVQLMSHQVEAVDFVLNAFIKQHGAVMALGMGMGKTLTTLSILDLIAESYDGSYMLVLAPSVIAPNWEKEFEMWNPPHITLHPIVMKMDRGTERLLKNAQSFGGLVVTTVDTFRLHTALFGQPKVIVIDEGHRIKNNRSQLFHAVDTMTTPYKMALTGTPLQNNLAECFTLINWISPGLLGSPKQFQKCFGDDIESSTDIDKSRRRVHMLKETLSQVVFRRDDLSLLLPPKEEYRVAVSCGGFQSPPNRSLFGKYHDALDHSMPYKIAAIVPMLSKIASLGASAVIFSGRKEMLKELQTYLSGPVMLGDTSDSDRQDMIADFQSGKVTRIYVSTKTGAQGINLTKGTHVIIADAGFNPTWEMQAVCRCWRIRQTQPVFVYRMIGEHTIEDNVYKNQLSKFALFARIVDDKEIDSLYTEDENGCLSLPSIDLLTACKDKESMKVLAEVAHIVKEVTKHEFVENDPELSDTDKEMAKNDFNVICRNNSRTLADVNGALVEVKPSDIFVGSKECGVLAPPFPPIVLAKVGKIIIQPAVPSYASFIIERCTRHEDGFEHIPLSPGNVNLKTTMVIDGEPGKEYAFRYKGVCAQGVSPWSQLSAYVKVV